MPSTTFPPVYEDLVDVLAADVSPERLLAFRLSPGKQERLDDLVAKSRAGTLDDDKAAELEAFLQFEHVVRMLKARALLNPRRQTWLEHFALDGERLVGLTDVGRTTIEFLQLNSFERLVERADFIRANVYPPNAN